MQTFSARQLYMMNGGNKLYIYKDGFGDVYAATPAEEAEWAREVIAGALLKIDTEENSVELMNAVENLLFHKYQGLDVLLLSKMKDANPARAIAFTTALWNLGANEQSVGIIYQNLAQHKAAYVNDFFAALDNFTDNAAKLFILTCMEGDDDELFTRATVTMGRWAYSGLPALRQNNLLAILQPANRHLPAFATALGQLKTIFQINNKR